MADALTGEPFAEPEDFERREGDEKTMRLRGLTL
jgi:hypothetical protein